MVPSSIVEAGREAESSTPHSYYYLEGAQLSPPELPVIETSTQAAFTAVSTQAALEHVRLTSLAAFLL